MRNTNILGQFIFPSKAFFTHFIDGNPDPENVIKQPFDISIIFIQAFEKCKISALSYVHTPFPSNGSWENIQRNERVSTEETNNVNETDTISQPSVSKCLK
jgi:hypothetical protein